MRLLNRFVVDHLTNDLPQHERGPLVAILWVTVRTGDQRLLPMAPLQARMHMSALVEVLGQVRQLSCSHSDRKRVRMDGNLDEGCPFFIAYPFRGRKLFSKPIPISSLPTVARVREVAASPVVPGRPAPRSPRPGRGSASFAPSGSSSGWDIARRQGEEFSRPKTFPRPSETLACTKPSGWAWLGDPFDLALAYPRPREVPCRSCEVVLRGS